MRLSFGIVAWALASCIATRVTAAAVDCSASLNRHVIKFYEYQGTQTPNGAEQFSIFRKVVDEEISSLNFLLAQRTGNIATEPGPAAGARYARGQLDPVVSLKVMNSDTRLLEILDGLLQLDPSTNRPLVHSEIYIVAKAGATTIRPLSEDILLDVANYDRARSLHLAATYYALSVDASSHSCRPAQITYLSRATEILHDIKTSSAGSKALTEMIQADQRALGVP